MSVPASWRSVLFCRRRRLVYVFVFCAVCACLGVFFLSTSFLDYRRRSQLTYRMSAVQSFFADGLHLKYGFAFGDKGQQVEANDGEESSSEKLTAPIEAHLQTAVVSPTLLLFTTWRWSEEKAALERSVLVTWPRWRPHIQPLLFSDNQTTLARARRHGWLVQHVPRVSCGDMPVLSAMFQSAIDQYESRLYGFANADLLFDDSLNSSIHALYQTSEHKFDLSNMMILSKRINTNWPKDFVLNDTTRLKTYAAKGHYPPEGSSDLFVTTSYFPWKAVPDLVVGRIGFGMWVVAFARARRVHTVDITPTCTLVHMTTESGNMESHSKPNKTCNLDMVKASKMEVNYDCGWIDCARFITRSGDSGKISVEAHEGPETMCLPCTQAI